MLVLFPVVEPSRARTARVPDSTSGLDVAQNLGDDRADVLQAVRAVQAA